MTGEPRTGDAVPTPGEHAPTRAEEPSRPLGRRAMTGTGRPNLSGGDR